MQQFIPYPAYAGDAPLDLSFLYEEERPAGRHGFLKACGDHFEFEDGTPGRFWGVNFNGGANFPEFSQSESVAKRLGKVGVNLVRFHQLDAEWNTPNIFQFTKGPRKGHTCSFDPESMKRLDYLIYCLKEAGIYVYMDIHTYRKFKSGDGIENAVLLADSAKPYSYFDRKMIELQKQFATDFWTHYNPYTKLQHKDDPVFVLGEVTNENDLFSFPITVEPYASEFRAFFQQWADETGRDIDAAKADINGDSEAVVAFKTELQRRYYEEIIGHLREIGVKIPMCGTNWYVNDACLASQLAGDFTDSHAYFYDWRWGEQEKHCMNQALSSTYDVRLAALNSCRILDKPFFCSEWDMPWPNEFRAESPILYAAVSSYQNWGGMAIHTYAYTSELERMHILGKEVSSSSIGGVPYREGIFSVWNDPAKFGLFYHSAMIVRRADVTPERAVTAVKSTDPVKTCFQLGKNAHRAVEQQRLAVTFDDSYEGPAIRDEDSPVREEDGFVRSGNGQLYRSWEKGYGTIDTPMTKCAYGQLNRNSPVALDGLHIDCKSDFAVIALSSLSKDPIDASDNLLLTTVGQAVNTDAKFVGDQMLDYGKAPILAEVIEAEISLATSCPTLQVWAVSAEGMFIGKVPSQYKDGKLCFRLGQTMRSIHYLIQAE